MVGAQLCFDLARHQRDVGEESRLRSGSGMSSREGGMEFWWENGGLGRHIFVCGGRLRWTGSRSGNCFFVIQYSCGLSICCLQNSAINRCGFDKDSLKKCEAHYPFGQPREVHASWWRGFLAGKNSWYAIGFYTYSLCATEWNISIFMCV